MAIKTQKFQTPSPDDPSSTNLCKVFVTFLYNISDIDVLKEYYSKFGNITNIKNFDSTTLMVEFERKGNVATTYRNASKVIIINRGQNYIATTTFINDDVSCQKCGNAENNKVILPEAANLPNAYPHTAIDNAVDTTPRKSSNSLVHSLNCQNITDNTFFCEQFATEAHQELCCNKTSSDKLVDIILEIASDDHLTIEDTLEKIKQYKNDFMSVQEEHLLLFRIEIISQIIHLFQTEVHFDVLLIKSSATISIDVTRKPNYILLDSHLSTDTKGPYMIRVLTTSSLEQPTEHVRTLIPNVENDVDNSFHLEMLNTIDEFIVKLEPFISPQLLPSIHTAALPEEQKQRNQFQNNADYPTGLIQSAKSQYTEGNVSACVIYATEACLRLLKGEIPSIVMINEIISSFKTDSDMQHLTIEEVLTDVERFSKGLKQIDVRQIILNNFEAELERLITDNIDYGPFGLLLVKPPEAISFIVMSQCTFIMFDSHKRNNTTGAYFDVGMDARQIIRKIIEIWPITQTSFDTYVADSEQYQLNLLNMCEVHLVLRTETTALPVLDISKMEKKRLIRETNEQRKEIDGLRRQIHDLKTIIDAISNGK